MNRTEGLQRRCWRLGTFNGPRVPFAANLVNEAQTKEHGKNAGYVCSLHIWWFVSVLLPSTGTVRPKVPRYVFVTLAFGGETNSREAFLNCAASCLFILRYEDAGAFRLLVHAQMDHPYQLWKRW